MRLEWIIYPAVQCGLEAVGLGLCLYLFLALKREARGAACRSDDRHSKLQALVESLQAELEGVKLGLQEAEERAGTLAAPVSVPSGLNLDKRTQALRMHRRGENPQQIAAALALRPCEVELMIEVQRVLLETADPG